MFLLFTESAPAAASAECVALSTTGTAAVEGIASPMEGAPAAEDALTLPDGAPPAQCAAPSAVPAEGVIVEGAAPVAPLAEG